MRGWLLTWRGQREEGLRQMRQGLSGWRATGAELVVPYFFSLLADGYCNLGQVDEALQTLQEGLEVIERTGELWWQAEIHRLQGEWLLHQGAPDGPLAENRFQQAVDIARQQQAKSLELRAATSLAACGSPRTSAKTPTIY